MRTFRPGAPKRTRLNVRNGSKAVIAFRPEAARQCPVSKAERPGFYCGRVGFIGADGEAFVGAIPTGSCWGGVAKDLTKIGVGVASFFAGAGLGGELLSALGPEAEAAIGEGIAESSAAKTATRATHSHLVDPKYMGGAADGERVDLVDELHRRFHGMLAKAQRDAGFPPVGGKSGSTVKWGEHFKLNPESRDEAYEILRRVSREFDELYGTNISSKLPPAPRSTGVRLPPPK